MWRMTWQAFSVRTCLVCCNRATVQLLQGCRGDGTARRQGELQPVARARVVGSESESHPRHVKGRSTHALARQRSDESRAATFKIRRVTSCHVTARHES
jgi:hypothetical protein